MTTTNAELLAAAERFAELDYGMYQGPLDCDADMRAAIKLARHVCEQLDETPRTCQRLVEMGFTERACSKYREFDLCDVTLRQVFNGEYPVEWVLLLNGYMNKCPKTMGGVRRLLAALNGDQ